MVQRMTYKLDDRWPRCCDLPGRRWVQLAYCPLVTVACPWWLADRARSGHVICGRALNLHGRGRRRRRSDQYRPDRAAGRIDHFRAEDSQLISTLGHAPPA
jgi:hypothetical protein